MEPSCPLGTTRCIPQAKFPQKPYKKSFIDQVCSVKMAGYWPRSFFCEFMDLDFVSVHKHAEKELGQYPAILTSHLVNNPYVLTLKPRLCASLNKGIFESGLNTNNSYFKSLLRNPSGSSTPSPTHPLRKFSREKSGENWGKRRKFPTIEIRSFEKFSVVSMASQLRGEYNCFFLFTFKNCPWCYFFNYNDKADSHCYNPSVTPTFLFRNRFYLQLSTYCPKMNKKIKISVHGTSNPAILRLHGA